MDPESNTGKPGNRGRLSRMLGAPAGYQRLPGEDELLRPHPSVILPQLKNAEKKFFQLVHSGDVTAVRTFLLENADFDVNCQNFQGVSALLVAVQVKSEDMVEFLLSQNIRIGDCVLHAIRDNLPKMLEMLLDHQRSAAPSLEFVGVSDSTDFPDYMTPLILAAQCGHYEIIQMLINRGHVINKPHSPSCRCNDCLVKLEKEDLLHAENLRLNLYRSFCNPAYICHSNYDPILASFQLSTELKECSRLVTEFRAVYMELSEQVSGFAVDLINCCRNSGEVELIMNEGHGSISKICIFPRLILAMDYKQKNFVAHPNTQHIVEKAWRGKWYEYNMKPVLGKILYMGLRVPMLPVIAVMSLAMPKHATVEHWNLPINRMLNHAAGFFIFLVVLFLESNMSKQNQKRRPPNSGLEPAILLFVVGNVWNIVRMCLIQGPKRYFRYLWNWHAVVSNMMFALTFVFWLASYLDFVKNDQVDLERKYWHHLDPVLIAEGTFAVATVMTYFKMMFFCRLNFYLGPLQISLGKMFADIAKYITIFVIIIFSFTCGLCRFYQYYDGMVQVDASSGIKTAQVSSFVDFTTTLKTFFWAVLCMSPLESADVIIENLPGETENTTIINKHTFTETIGYIAFALFEVLSVIMILNMLIATMSSTFQRVLDNIDIEWIFGKTDFYLEYMMQSTLPSPLNLIPTSQGITLFMELFQTLKPNLDEEHNRDEYPALMTQLVQRYFREKDSADAEINLENIKTEIVELKQTVAGLVKP